MKKLGELVLRGRIGVNINGHRLQIFDGKYTTGYRVKEFRIGTHNPVVAEEIVAKLHTSKTTSSISQWDWGDNQEIAWTGHIYPTDDSYIPSLVVQDNMVVEDLYLSNYSPTGDTTDQCNYYIVLEKYEFKAWDGAAIMVENLSQGGPQ